MDYQTDLVTLPYGDDLPVNIGRFRLFQTNSPIPISETILAESRGEVIESEPLAQCSDQIIQDLSDYYIPRSGETLWEIT